MNWLDRVIGYVSPTSGLKRQAARKMLTRQVPARAGKRFVGSDRDFGTISNNPDDGRSKKYIDRMTILRLVADNPFARKAMNALLNSYVGWGVSGAPAGTKKLVKMWLEWIENCDYDGVQDLYGLQELWATSQFRDGEVFIVNRLVEVEPGQIPLRLQTFDKGMLATHKVGANIRRGIEYDAEGRPIAYHFYRGRPGQAWSSSQTHSFPAEHVIHLFHREWVGQTEGSSVFESVIKRLGDVDEGIEAEVVKANISACMVGFRYRAPNQDGDDPRMGLATGEDIDGSPVEEFRPGMIETLDEGEQITFSTPPKTGGIGDLARLALLAAAAGTNVTYEQLTGDLSNVNFSSYRAGALEFKRTMGRLQYLTLIPICLNRIFAWFMDTGYIHGLLPSRTAKIKWTPPPFESIDRKGDAEADILEMQAGLENRPNLLNSRGYDHASFIAETAASLKESRGLGLAFLGDPVAAAAGETDDANADDDADRLLVAVLTRMISRRQERGAPARAALPA